MNSQNILYSKGKNDECHTLPYAVKPILKYIPDEWIIWCPFDNEKSEFVRQFRNKGNKVIHSHISEGKDFYKVVRKAHSFRCGMDSTFIL